MSELSELTELLRARRPLAAAPRTGTASGPVRVRRGASPAGWLVDGEDERPVSAHRSAHQRGQPSEATVVYGYGHDEERVAQRLADLASLADETGLLRAVMMVPAHGDSERPGSWGVEDLTAVAVARAALPASVTVRPCWRLLGAQACQVALAFGADGWAVPADEPRDLQQLAAAVGRDMIVDDE